MIRCICAGTLIPGDIPENLGYLAVVTHLFAYVPDSFSQETPGSVKEPIVHSGRGPIELCEASGEWFPSSRMRQNDKGQSVGDFYYVDSNPLEMEQE